MDGIIVLYTKEGDQVGFYKYDGLRKRNERLRTWKRQFGVKRFGQMYYHIIPSARPELVSKEGLNTKRVANKDKFDIKRPPAKYDNDK